MADVELDRSQVLAFRTIGHGLAARRHGAGSLLDAIGRVGLRRTKNAHLSLAARLDSIGPGDEIDRALDDGRLVAFYGARGTVMMAAPDDVPVLTLGTAPSDEESLRAAIPGAYLRQLDRATMPATEALQAVIEAIREVLADGPLPRGETAMAVTAQLPRLLTPPCRGRCPDPHVEDSLFRLAGVNGTMRFGGSGDELVAVDAPERDAVPAMRAEFVHRYLGCYGPSTPAAMAAWAGISTSDAKRSLEALGNEVVPVSVDGRPAGVILADHTSTATSAVVEGVRFLPPFDPYLLDRDRTLLVPDRAAQKVVWRAAGNPGVLLMDGEPVATWRTRKKSGTTTLAIEPFDTAAPVDRPDVHEEARRVASLVDRNQS